MKKLTIMLAVGALAPFALAACGGSDSSSTSSTTASSTTPTGAGGSTSGGGETVNVAADPSGAFKFDPASLSAKAGSDTFDFTNDSPVTHDFCIEDSSGNQVGCTDQISGSTATLTEDLQAGSYTFYCSVDGHRAAGMEGTLTVK